MQMEYAISEKRKRALDVVDAMPPELRACVHELGLPIVAACVKYGVTSPKQIRDLVREIWEGARHTGQRRPTLGSLDWVLMQAGANISAATLVRILADNSHAIVPIDPTATMLDASMNECSTFTERVTKREKHRRRLRAAIEAAINKRWM